MGVSARYLVRLARDLSGALHGTSSPCCSSSSPVPNAQPKWP